MGFGEADSLRAKRSEAIRQLKNSVRDFSRPNKVETVAESSDKAAPLARKSGETTIPVSDTLSDGQTLSDVKKELAKLKQEAPKTLPHEYAWSQTQEDFLKTLDANKIKEYKNFKLNEITNKKSEISKLQVRISNAYRKRDHSQILEFKENIDKLKLEIKAYNLLQEADEHQRDINFLTSSIEKIGQLEQKIGNLTQTRIEGQQSIINTLNKWTNKILTGREEPSSQEVSNEAEQLKASFTSMLEARKARKQRLDGLFPTNSSDIDLDQSQRQQIIEQSPEKQVTTTIDTPANVPLDGPSTRVFDTPVTPEQIEARKLLEFASNDKIAISQDLREALERLKTLPKDRSNQQELIKEVKEILYRNLGEDFYEIDQKISYIESLRRLSSSYTSPVPNIIKHTSKQVKGEIQYYLNSIEKLLPVLETAQENLGRFEKQRISFSMLDGYQEIIDEKLYNPINYKKDQLASRKRTLEETIANCKETKDKLDRLKNRDDPIWYMNKKSLSEDKIHTELRRLFPQAAEEIPEIIKKMAKAKCILMDQAYCDQIMKNLQEEMMKYKNINLSLDEILQIYEKEDGFGTQPIESIQWQSDPNFKPEETGLQTRIQVNKPLSPGLFLEIGAQGELMIDTGVPFSHGPWIHRFQEHILGRAIEDNKFGIGDLLNNTAEFYQNIAHPLLRIDTFGDRKLTGWDIIFESDGESANSVVGLSGDESQWVQNNIHAYSHSMSSMEHIRNMLPLGPLKRELALTLLRQRHLSKDNFFNDEELHKDAINEIINIEQKKFNYAKEYVLNIIYDEKEINSFIRERKSLEQKEIGLLKSMSLEDLEEFYANLGHRIPSEDNFEGDYRKKKEAIFIDSN